VSTGTAVGCGLLGAALLVIGIVLATDWRGALLRYSDLTDALTPTTRRDITRRLDRPKSMAMNRGICIVASIAGAGLLAAVLAKSV
jgi:hypothetical protein